MNCGWGDKKRSNGLKPLLLCLVLPEERGCLLLLSVEFVGNSQFLATLGAACCQYSTAVGGSHSLAETVFVLSLSQRGLECSFHFLLYFIVILVPISRIGWQKYCYFFNRPRICPVFLQKEYFFLADRLFLGALRVDSVISQGMEKGFPKTLSVWRNEQVTGSSDRKLTINLDFCAVCLTFASGKNSAIHFN